MVRSSMRASTAPAETRLPCSALVDRIGPEICARTVASRSAESEPEIAGPGRDALDGDDFDVLGAHRRRCRWVRIALGLGVGLVAAACGREQERGDGARAQHGTEWYDGHWSEGLRYWGICELEACCVVLRVVGDAAPAPVGLAGRRGAGGGAAEGARRA